jgi:hypothetical protein
LGSSRLEFLNQATLLPKLSLSANLALVRGKEKAARARRHIADAFARFRLDHLHHHPNDVARRVISIYNTIRILYNAASPLLQGGKNVKFVNDQKRLRLFRPGN